MLLIDTKFMLMLFPCSTSFFFLTKFVFYNFLILQLTGSFDGLGYATMTKCDWHEDYTEVPKCQRRNLFKKFYQKNCGCIVSKLQIIKIGHVMDGWMDGWNYPF